MTVISSGTGQPQGNPNIGGNRPGGSRRGFPAADTFTLKSKALEMAFDYITHAAVDVSAEQVIDVAKTFEAYLGDTSNA